ncbi:cobalt-precorrin 5A hydrolase [Pararhizobium capsulatum DSM 1112]|uniref:Cobalt-precorrin 5A hydrolase n=1 Tax=Pararhizobium capsulatum DSM 1112 TaxID=1121113 RepID=A0ABU0BSQ5_9HYPH|nr:cobalt-precorrin 5A hydrolase [Pararhizobium capsulatum DSM 1112]
MAEHSDARMVPSPELVLGIGCERGADPAEIISLAKSALDRCGRPARDVMLVASIDTRASEPAIIAAARHFGVPLRFFSAAVLEALTPRLANPSALVFAYTACHGVAEAAALAGGGEVARLVVPKLKSHQATIAIAESSQSVVAAGSEIESTISQSDSGAPSLPNDMRSREQAAGLSAMLLEGAC